MEELKPDTIYALASGAGRAGIAVIRVSGPGARDAIRALSGIVPEPRQATLRTLREPGAEIPIDQAVLLYFEAPRSFTGEDVAEFHVHGGPSVIAGVVAALESLPGFRPAEAGEFARRAFESGRLDLVEVEGLADLIEAETREQRLQALRQSSGAIGAVYDDWRRRLVGALALVEASLDFSDEADVPALIENDARPVVDALLREINVQLEDRRAGERLREGFTIALTGAPNAGKSSLLNALARRDVAIVSDEAGTTRDVLEVHLDLGGYPVKIVDTAGLREAAGPVEREGVRRALVQAREADLVVWLVDATQPVWQPPENLDTSAVTVTVLNKIDAARPAPQDDRAVLPVSARSGEGLDDFIRGLSEHAERSLSGRHPAVITRARHRRELLRAAKALDGFLAGDARELELRAEDLRIAAQALGRVTGAVDVEDILDRIFADFCIGK